MKKIMLFIAISLIALTTCISEYNPGSMEDLSGLLVVHGIITEGETTIQLSLSADVGRDLPKNIYIADAEVNVECTNGEYFNTIIQKPDSGIYIIDIPKFEPEQKYRLNIYYKDEKYHSEFLSPLYSPEIKKTYWLLDWGKTVNILVETENDMNDSPYYKWQFEEIWEYHTELVAQGSDLATSNNTYYCWAYNLSKGLIIGSSEKNKTNYAVSIIKKIPLTSDKLSIMYQIKVKQYSIREEGYNYFQNLQKNVDEIGGLFSPIPSELPGNIKCETNPDKHVVGYVDVATFTYTEMFISGKENLYSPPPQECQKLVVESVGPPFPSYELYYVAGTTAFYAPATCLDCRLIHNGTKNKPENWPTSNL